MLSPRVGMCRGCRKVVKTCWHVVRPSMDALPLSTVHYYGCVYCLITPPTRPIFRRNSQHSNARGMSFLVFSASMDGFVPAKRSWQPSYSHGTYQLEAMTSCSRQLLMVVTWLPETCWASSIIEIKNTKVTYIWFFLSTLNYDARSTTYQEEVRYGIMWGGDVQYKCDGFSEDGDKQMRTWLGDQKRVLKLRGWGPFAAQKLMGSKHNSSGSQRKQIIRNLQH
jgi:hypothetical protein